MRAPHISLEHASEVTEYFSKSKPSWPVTKGIHLISGLGINAATHFDVGAKDMIAEDLKQGRQLLVAHNHQSNVDPFVLASIIQREKMLRPMRNKIVIPGKSPLFNNPLYGWVVRRSGAVPVFRRSELEGSSDDPHVEDLRRQANNSLVDILLAHMNRGLHGAIYPEGSRGFNKNKQGERVDLTRLQPLHAGIGRLACGMDDPDNLSIVCVGTVYGFHHNQRLNPTSVIARPFAPGETIDEVVAKTGENLQHAVTTAHEITRILRT